MIMAPSLAYPSIGLEALRRAPSEDQFGSVQVRPVQSLDDLQRVFAIRAAVFMAEQSCPYDEEYDGNDLAAMHLIATIGKEPLARCVFAGLPVSARSNGSASCPPCAAATLSVSCSPMR